MAFNPADPTYQRLLDRVLQTEGRVVPFVGAGLSVYGDSDRRLPLWGELLERLIDEGRRLGLISEAGDPAIDEAMQDGRYIEATDRILDALGEPTFRRSVEEQLDENGKEIPPAITELVSVKWPLVVTTNLDRMIAVAYLERYRRPITTVTNLDIHKMIDVIGGTHTSSETALLQIHGSIDIYPSWKLTKAHYEQLLREPGYLEALKQLFLRQVFFVGFGLQDDDFDYLLQTIAEIYHAGAGEIYALIAESRKGSDAVQRLIKVSGLKPIYYDDGMESESDGPFGKHRAVYECLAHMSQNWAAVHFGMNVTLKYFPELDPHMLKREEDIRSLRDLVNPGAIVQVVGLGGSGKTSLVQQFLVEQRSRLAAADFKAVFGCSLYRADIGQLIQDLTLSTVGATTEPLPQRVERICHHVRNERTLLVLDGVEVTLDERKELRNPYLLQIVESVLQGGGAVVLTSRVPVRGGIFENASEVDVSPLTPEEIREFLDRWGLEGLDDAAKQRLGEITAGHPLALRILAGLLMDIPERDAIAAIERSSVIDVSDEVDPLRENRLARVLGSYLQHLGDAEMTFLTCSAAFDGPVPYSLVEATLTRPYPDTPINAGLVGQDLRPIVESLMDRRLLTVGAGAELSSHPTVREYFDRKAHQSEHSLQPLHRFLAGEYLRDAVRLPDTFEEALPLLTAARHAAACQDWTLFDDIFRHRLMRGPRQYLCNNLGAWEEALSLARLGNTSDFPASSTPEPAFYPATVARCLKHLGRSSESRTRYLDALALAALTRDSDTAKYLNNFLTLLIWRGELLASDLLVEANIRALSWIEEEWKKRWQIEHGFATFAYLRMLQGHTHSASRLFDFAADAWKGYQEDRAWMYDYYPYYRSELILLEDPGGHDEALLQIESLLSVAHEQSWPESIGRGHIQASVVLLDRASQRREPADLVRADQRLDEAQQIPAGMNLPDVAISHLLTRLKSELVHHELYGKTRLDSFELKRSIRRLELLMESSGLALAAPEVAAVQGSFLYLQGEVEQARRYYDRAVAQCRDQGNVLALKSRRSLVYWLGRRFDSTAAADLEVADIDLIDLVGSELDPDWMTDRLERLKGEKETCYRS
jgi:hypothetical protein